MKSAIFVLGAALGCAGAVCAQEEPAAPRYEVGFTYSGFHAHSGNNNSQLTTNGGAGVFEYNINKWRGAIADLGGYANTRSGIDDKAFTYLFGPRFNWRHNRFTPYAQALFGGGYAWSGANANNQNAFAFAIGGGLDYALSRHLAIKPFQVEYFRTQFDSARLGGATSNFGDHQNGVRYSAGVVLRFGGE